MRLDNSMTFKTSRRSFLSKMISLVSRATSLPPPIAIPRSALANARASLTPSPTIATRCLSSCLKLWIIFCLSVGSISAITSSTATSLAIALATFLLSPVNMTTLIPLFFNSFIACLEFSLTLSLIEIIPIIFLFFEIINDVFPSSEYSSYKFFIFSFSRKL